MRSHFGMFRFFFCQKINLKEKMIDINVKERKKTFHELDLAAFLSLSACVYLRSEEKQIFFSRISRTTKWCETIIWKLSIIRADFPLAQNSIDFRMCSRRFSKKVFFASLITLKLSNSVHVHTRMWRESMIICKYLSIHHPHLMQREIAERRTCQMNV